MEEELPEWGVSRSRDGHRWWVALHNQSLIYEDHRWRVDVPTIDELVSDYIFIGDSISGSEEARRIYQEALRNL